MPPKIEVLDDENSIDGGTRPEVTKEVPGSSPTIPKKNPFASTSRSKTTVKVDPKTITDTSYRNQPKRGLNVPGYVSNSPIDKLFKKLEDAIMGSPLEELTIPVLQQKLATTGEAAIQSTTNTSSQYQVVELLLDYLLQIQDLSQEASTEPGHDVNKKDLITISLHDIRTFSRLVNLIIIHGVYPAINTYQIGIPFEKRRLNEFSKMGSKSQIRIQACQGNHNDGSVPERLLLLLFDKFLALFTSASTSSVKDLLLRGTGYSDFLTVTLTLLAVPTISGETKRRVQAAFPTVIGIPDTFELFQTLSLLLSSPSPAYFKAFVSSQIQLLHVKAPRKDGLLTLCEFVLGLRENEEVDIEKFDHVANVVLSKPKSIPTVEYFKSIGDQSYELLVNINKPIVTSCICYVLEKLWDKNKRIVIDFLLKKIWNRSNPTESTEPKSNESVNTLVSESSVNNNINVLISLTKNNPSQSLLLAAFSPILPYLWSYYLFLKSNGKPLGIVKSIFVSYFTILSVNEGLEGESKDGFNQLDVIVKNISSDGGVGWKYTIGDHGLVKIIERQPASVTSDTTSKMGSFLASLDIGIELLIDLLTDLGDNYIEREFITIFKRWLKIDKQSEGSLDESNPFFVLVDLRILESMGEKFSTSLGKSPLEMLEIVDGVLSSSGNNHKKESDAMQIDKDVDSDDEDEEGEKESSLPILLQLLSAILTETNSSELSGACNITLQNIQSKLKEVDSPTSKLAAEALNERITGLLSGEKNTTEQNTQTEKNAKTLKLAITSLNDPLVPIRAHGLHLLRQLIEGKNDDVVSLDFVVELHLNQLKDPEPFIYLNVIKGLEQLIQWDENKVIPLYMEIYTGESNDLDERLRIGEVLLRYVQSSNELFSGLSATAVVQGALSLIRRRSAAEELEFKVDNRLRHSSMSILGVCCMTNPLGMIDSIGNALDCAFGILKLETSPDEAVLRRSAIVLLHDLIIGTSKSSKLPFPESYRNETWNTLNYVFTNDNDLLVRDQAKTVLNTIEELAKGSHNL